MMRVRKPVKPLPAAVLDLECKGVDDEDDGAELLGAGTSGPPFWSGGSDETLLRFNETWDPIWYPEGLERGTQRKTRGKNV